ncbi:DNA repair protein XRCC4-like [Salvia miltiorrhiza]|uniref:DNA repair protein XRCC4-like n=1 Tax=Salvia miltiorrhiza TaxID=226208 RepID=UPI0025AD7DCC|nr:DNA repair protein XRCC4-like [Salvia miltiorrhiza]
MEAPKHTCLKLEIAMGGGEPVPIFVKGTWYPTRFDLAITDGHRAWTCNATEEAVEERASYWDQTASYYIDLAERYLGFQQPGSVYGFSDAGDGCKRLSWTFEKEGMKLEWRWKCQPSPNSKATTVEVLDFLMDANIKLSEEVVWKSQSFDKLKLEAEKCLAQSEKLSSDKSEFESEIYGKFVQVLNSKKAKLRALRDRLSRQPSAENFPQEDEVSSDRTESLDEESDEERDRHSRRPPAVKKTDKEEVSSDRTESFDEEGEDTAKNGGVSSSKKADKLSRPRPAVKKPENEEVSSDRTESFGGEDEDDAAKNGGVSSSKNAPTINSRGRKRK